MTEYRLFISHAWGHNDEYYKLEIMLNNSPYFKWKNYSVPQHDGFEKETDLEEALKRQIRPVNAVLILAGMYANYSDWIEFEVEFSESISKPIIVVKPWGQQRIPSYLQEIANKPENTMVGWNIESIVTAIRNYSI